MSESEQRMNNTQSENGANTSEQRWDLGTLFPAKGDPRKPPEWLGRALLYIAIAIVGFTFCWRSWGKIEYLVIDIIVSLFIYAWPAFHKFGIQFIWRAEWDIINEEFGAAIAIVGTLASAGIALLIAVPLFIDALFASSGANNIAPLIATPYRILVMAILYCSFYATYRGCFNVTQAAGQTTDTTA